MRYFAIIFATLVLIDCKTTHDEHGQSRNQVSAPDSIVQYLLNAAATDINTHRPPHPVRFRDIHISHVTITRGIEQFMFCGEILPDQKEGNAEWTPFVTIMTSDY
jgi:hypothetical protein